MCGEKGSLPRLPDIRRGSPPRVRGKVLKIQQTPQIKGITPACAGKSLLPWVATEPERDHPRVCGEKKKMNARKDKRMGSPPRVRGKVACKDGSPVTFRITPACAGKRLLLIRPETRFGDHPRVCGEKLTTFDAGKLVPGSPPRVRGKVTGYFGVLIRIRITPACAGKRLKRSHSIGHFSCILCLFHSVLHRASVSGGSRAGPCAPPCLPAQNAVPV